MACFQTIKPNATPEKRELNFNTDNYYVLADGQFFIVPAFSFQLQLFQQEALLVEKQLLKLKRIYQDNVIFVLAAATYINPSRQFKNRLTL